MSIPRMAGPALKSSRLLMNRDSFSASMMPRARKVSCRQSSCLERPFVLLPAVTSVIIIPASTALNARIRLIRADSLTLRCSKIWKSRLARRAKTPPSGGVVPVLACVIPFRVMAICARILIPWLWVRPTQQIQVSLKQSPK